MAFHVGSSKKPLSGHASCYFPFGNGTVSRDAIKTFKSNKCKSQIKVCAELAISCSFTNLSYPFVFQALFLDCQDLRNVLCSMELVNPDWVLDMHLNTSCPLSFPRNILLLKVISSPKFDPENSTDLNYLWDLWYNAAWTKPTVDRFLTDVQELVDAIMTEQQFSKLDAKKKNELKETLQSWILFLEGRASAQLSQLSQILTMRYNT